MKLEVLSDKGPQIIPLRAFRDNYIWLLRLGPYAAVIDPGEAAPVLAYLAAEKLQLLAILATHHHDDHVGGIAEILAQLQKETLIPVYGPQAENIAGVTQALVDGDRVDLPALQSSFEVMEVPGHTRGHIAYYGRQLCGSGAVFCGDTLFACGCGRIFEGTPAQMWQSLCRLAALPAATRVYCAHEYTEANIQFALAVEPDNADLGRRATEVAELRAKDLPTVPSTLADELATNPFLRAAAPQVRHAAANFSGTGPIDDDAVFTAIRAWKNKF